MEKIITIPESEDQEGFKTRLVAYLGKCVQPVVELTQVVAEQQAERQTAGSKKELIFEISE